MFPGNKESKSTPLHIGEITGDVLREVYAKYLQVTREEEAPQLSLDSYQSILSLLNRSVLERTLTAFALRLLLEQYPPDTTRSMIQRHIPEVSPEVISEVVSIAQVIPAFLAEVPTVRDARDHDSRRWINKQAGFNQRVVEEIWMLASSMKEMAVNLGKDEQV